jgi:hypothetical protein
MDVFVIPVGPTRYELYCEQPFSADLPATALDEGLLGRIRRRFEELLRRAEQWEPPEAGVSRSLFARLQDRGMAWLAQRVVEQRLLWNLRRESTVTAVHADDLTIEQVHGIVHRLLQEDLDRHKYWVWVDGTLFAVTFVVLGPVFLLIPGIANLPAIYFGIRTVGHWYSCGGARHGLRSVSWTGRSAPPLTELRDVDRVPADARERLVHDVANRLDLRNLSSFYDRVRDASL